MAPRSEPRPKRLPIAIVGGGFSGALTAVRLLAADDGPPVVLVEPDAALGRGPAYGCASERRLLNVHAGAMSAFAERPLDFHAFAHRRDPEVRPEDYLPRPLFGDYVAATLAAAVDAAPEGRFRRVAAAARDVRRETDGTFVLATEHGPIAAAELVVAVGPPGVARPPGFPAAPDPRVIVDPRRREFSASDPLDLVLVVGTGLTMLDVALDAAAASRTSRIVAVSRRGLLPEAHLAAPATPCPPELCDPRTWIGAPARDVVRGLRAALRAAGPAWRGVLAALRPATDAIWRGFSPADRGRVLRRWFVYWNVIRHRAAPAADDVLATLRAAGRLEIVRGALDRCTAPPEGGPLQVVLRGPDGERRDLRPTMLVNAVGPDFRVDERATTFPAALLRAGLARRGPLGLGLDVAPDGGLLAPNGAVVPGAFVVGPLRFGAEFETTAVPELRRQAATAAEAILARRRAAGAS